MCVCVCNIYIYTDYDCICRFIEISAEHYALEKFSVSVRY